MQHLNHPLKEVREKITSQEQTIQMLPYEESSNAVILIAKWYLHQQDPSIEFKLDDELKRLYRILTLYFTNNPEFEQYSLKVTGGKIPYSLKKGNLLIGPTGRSKTFCYEKIFKYFTNKFISQKKYRIINSHMIQMSFENEGIKALNSYRHNARNNHDNIYIDEIGMEELTVQHFGNKQNPLQSFLHERHRLFISSNGEFITHGSSNLKLNSAGDEINMKNAYGDRIYSRLYEMFNIIIITGTDLRINILPT